jgi:hypothetical protein
LDLKCKSYKGNRKTEKEKEKKKEKSKKARGTLRPNRENQPVAHLVKS